MQKEGKVHVRLSKAIYNFTDTQDLRLAVGYKAKLDEKMAIRGVSAPSCHSCASRCEGARRRETCAVLGSWVPMYQ